MPTNSGKRASAPRATIRKLSAAMVRDAMLSPECVRLIIVWLGGGLDRESFHLCVRGITADEQEDLGPGTVNRARQQ